MVVHTFDVHPEFPVRIAHQAQVMQDGPAGGAMFTRRWGNARPTRTYTLPWASATLAEIARVRFLWSETRGAGEMLWAPTEECRILYPALPPLIRVKFWEMPSLPVEHGAVLGRMDVVLASVVPDG